MSFYSDNIGSTCYDTAALVCSGDGQYYNSGTCSSCTSGYEPNDDRTGCKESGTESKIACNNVPAAYKSYATYIEEADKCFVNLGLPTSAPTWNSVDCQTATQNNTRVLLQNATLTSKIK